MHTKNNEKQCCNITPLYEKKIEYANKKKLPATQGKTINCSVWASQDKWLNLLYLCFIYSPIQPLAIYQWLFGVKQPHCDFFFFLGNINQRMTSSAFNVLQSCCSILVCSLFSHSRSFFLFNRWCHSLHVKFIFSTAQCCYCHRWTKLKVIWNTFC